MGNAKLLTNCCAVGPCNCIKDVVGGFIGDGVATGWVPVCGCTASAIGDFTGYVRAECVFKTGCHQRPAYFSV